MTEQKWSESTALKGAHPTARAAAEAGDFCVTAVDRDFWKKVRLECESQVGDGMPSEVLGLVTEGGQLVRRPQAAAKDNKNIRKAFEIFVTGEVGAFAPAQRDDRHRLAVELDGYHIPFPRMMPDTSKAQRESDLQSLSYGEIRAEGAVDAPHMQPLSVADVKHTQTFRNTLNPNGAANLSDADLSAAMQKGENGGTYLGVDRQIETEGGKVRNRARFLDARALACQWMVQSASELDGEGDQTIEVAMEPWIDGTTIGGHSCVAALLTFRPVDPAALDGEKHLRPRIAIFANDTRETREVYELFVRILAVQLRAADSL